MNQNLCIFEYSNLGNAYLKITCNSTEILLDGEDITKTDLLVDKIKVEMKKLGIVSLPKVLLLLRCNEMYRTTLSLPVKNYLQASHLYNKDLKSKVNKDLYQTITLNYKYDLGHIFNTYYMPKSVIDSFEIIAKKLGTTIDQIKPYGLYLFDLLNYKGNYVYFYIKNKACTMILVSNDNLLTSFDFEYQNSKTISNNFFLVASKFEFEFEKLSIEQYGISSDEPIEFNIGLKQL